MKDIYKGDLFIIYDTDLGRKRAMTIKEITQSGVASINQPYPLVETGRDIEGKLAGYVIYDKRGHTYLGPELTWWNILVHQPMLFPVTIEINNKNTGYHYQINMEAGYKL